jgi:hypothetical protein
MHSTYPTLAPTNIQLEGKLASFNPRPKQFCLGTLNERKTYRLREIQHLDTLHDLDDPEPDDHIWKCIAVTKHKLQNIKEDDIHIKVKAIWGDGEESWIRADAFSTQDPYPLITYAVKQGLSKQSGWEWTRDYLQNDDHIASMVKAYKRSVNGTQSMFGIEIPKNVKRALEMDKENGNNLWPESIDKELGMIN